MFLLHFLMLFSRRHLDAWPTGFEWFSFAFAALYSLPIFAHLSARDVFATALSTPPFLFPVVLVCVMGPRALNGHTWYKKTFGDKFPTNRKALIPFIL